jgi:hypothetical protein
VNAEHSRPLGQHVILTPIGRSAMRSGKMAWFELLRGNAVLAIVTFAPAGCGFSWRGGWLEPTEPFA